MDEHLPRSLYPLFAPLPVPMVEHLATAPMRQAARRNLPFDLTSYWQKLAHDMQWVRTIVFTFMRPFVTLEGRSRDEKRHEFSTQWLFKVLSSNTPNKKRIGRITLTEWRQRGLLRFTEYGRPDPDSAAALFAARLIDKRERGWLPSELKPEEPHYWCWCQLSPETEPFPCPIPLPRDLPPSALCWTPWPGASWYPVGPSPSHWLLIGDSTFQVGAIRWAGIRMQRGQLFWNIRYEDLLQWTGVERFIFESPKYPHMLRDDMINDQATFTLRHLALHRLVP